MIGGYVKGNGDSINKYIGKGLRLQNSLIVHIEVNIDSPYN